MLQAMATVEFFSRTRLSARSAGELLVSGRARMLYSVGGTLSLYRSEERMDTATDLPVGAPGGGLSHVIGEIIATEGGDLIRVDREARFLIALPERVLAWIADPDLPRTLAANRWGDARRPGQTGGGEVRRLTGGEAASEVAGRYGWRCSVRMASGWGDLSWLVFPSHGEKGGRLPRDVASGVQRLASALGVRTAEAVAVHRSDGARLQRVESVYIVPSPVGCVVWSRVGWHRLHHVCATRYSVPSAVARWSEDDVMRLAALNLVDGELSRHGLARLVTAHPRTPLERRGRYAVRTVARLIESGGVQARTLVDTSYASGDSYRALARLIPWFSPRHRANLAAGYGRRRWDRLATPALQTVTRGGAPPWEHFVTCCERALKPLVARVITPGRRPPPRVGELLRHLYLDQRTQRLRFVWRDHIERGSLAVAIDQARLSRLRRALPHVGRERLILSCVGESAATRSRLTAIYSRRGRELFEEDVWARTREIERDEYLQWEELLAARARVVEVARTCR